MRVRGAAVQVLLLYGMVAAQYESESEDLRKKGIKKNKFELCCFGFGFEVRENEICSPVVVCLCGVCLMNEL